MTNAEGTGIMKRINDTFKTTTLNVVVFSVVSVLMWVIVGVLLNALVALVVWKTAMPMSFLKIGNIIAGGVSVVVSSVFLSKRCALKGVYLLIIHVVLITLTKMVVCGFLGDLCVVSLRALVGFLALFVFSALGSMIGVTMRGR